MSIIPIWVKLLVIGGVIAGVSITVNSWDNRRLERARAEGRAEVKKDWDADVTVRLVEQAATEKRYREKENVLNEMLTTERTEHEKYKARREATSLLVAGQLRDYAAALAEQQSRAGQGTGAAAGANDPTATIASECPPAVAALDGHAQVLADQVTGLQRYITKTLDVVNKE